MESQAQGKYMGGQLAGAGTSYGWSRQETAKNPRRRLRSWTRPAWLPRPPS